MNDDFLVRTPIVSFLHKISSPLRVNHLNPLRLDMAYGIVLPVGSNSLSGVHILDIEFLSRAAHPRILLSHGETRS